MTDVELTLRRASRTDRDAVAAVLARAFADDPVIRWFVPARESRPDRLYRFFDTTLSREILPFGVVEMAERKGEIVGASLWRRPDNLKTTGWRALLDLPHWWRVFGSDLGKAAAGQKAFATAHPQDRRHWYLPTVGVDPAAQGTGVGSALLRSMLRRCDEQDLPAYLESTSSRNIPLYQRYGFQLLGEERHLPDGPPFWPMWREPETATGS